MSIEKKAVKTVLIFSGPEGDKPASEMTKEELLDELEQLVEDRDRLRRQVIDDFTYMRDSAGCIDNDHRPAVADLFGEGAPWND